MTDARGKLTDGSNLCLYIKRHCMVALATDPFLTSLIRHDLLQNNNCVSNWLAANFRLFNG